MKISRRTFIAAGVAGAVVGVPRSGSGAASDASTRLRAAVIGHTGRGDYGHGLEAAFSDRPGVDLVGLADPDPAGRTAMAAKIRAPRAYADFRELLERERPQAVCIAMRHSDQHHAIGLACLRAGAHCYFEKPLARSMVEADELLAEAERRGLRIGVAHTMRMMPVVAQLKRAIEQGRLGEIRELRAYGKQDARAGGEDLMVLGTHLFDLMRLFAGDPRWASGEVLVGGRPITREDRRQVKDNVGWVAGDQVAAQFGFDRGVQASFVSDGRLRDTVGRWGIEFHGSRGVARILCDLEPSVLMRETTGWNASGRTDRWVALDEGGKGGGDGGGLEQAIRRPVDDWLAALREGRDPECSGRNGAWAVEMALAVYQASLTMARVGFPTSDRRHPLEG